MTTETKSKTEDSQDAPSAPVTDDAGRKRKFLCVVDASPECNVAVYYAARRAKHVGGAVSLLYVIEPGDFQHWASVKDVMAKEARDEAEDILKGFSDRVLDVSGHPAELVIREGKGFREEWSRASCVLSRWQRSNLSVSNTRYRGPRYSVR
jgi:hypothetical protein